jgi:hypothetical protein
MPELTTAVLEAGSAAGDGSAAVAVYVGYLAARARDAAEYGW